MNMRATIPGILDSDVARDGAPISAHTLRELARTANLLRDAPCLVLCQGAPRPATEANPGIRLPYPNPLINGIWRIVGREACPTARIAITYSLDEEVTARVEARTSRGRAAIEVTGAAAGARKSAEWTVPIGADDRLELWWSWVDSETSTAFGSPSTWSGTNATRFHSPGRNLLSISGIPASMAGTWSRTERYMAIAESTSGARFHALIVDSDSSPEDLYLGSPIPTWATTQGADPASVTWRIAKRGQLRLWSIAVRVEA